jgi:hypothetical protein
LIVERLNNVSFNAKPFFFKIGELRPGVLARGRRSFSGLLLSPLNTMYDVMVKLDHKNADFRFSNSGAGFVTSHLFTTATA